MCNPNNPNTIIAYATVISVVLTFILVIITTIQNKKTINEMKEGRKRSAIPIITFELEVDTEKSLSAPGLYNKIFIQNIGNTPAQETEVTLKPTNPTSRVLINPQEWKLFLVGEDQQKVKKIEGTLDTAKVLSNLPTKPTLEITSTSKNSYGVISKTIAEFELQQSAWIKLKEIATIV